MGVLKFHSTQKDYCLNHIMVSNTLCQARNGNVFDFSVLPQQDVVIWKRFKFYSFKNTVFSKSYHTAN